jgi:hypothetical protein
MIFSTLLYIKGFVLDMLNEMNPELGLDNSDPLFLLCKQQILMQPFIPPCF